MKNGPTPEEVDDFITEFGTKKTPMEVFFGHQGMPTQKTESKEEQSSSQIPPKP